MNPSANLPLSRRKNDYACAGLVAAVVVGLAAGCDLEKQANYQHDVEVAPNKWLTLKERRGRCWFVCEWNGKKVTWPGKRNRLGEVELPRTLREYDDNLFLIVSNREDSEDPKHRYLKLNRTGTGFVEILPAEFPKSIATQNMELDPEVVGVGDKRINSWEVMRKLDVEHPYFSLCATADIWIELETGLNQQKVRKMIYDKRKRIIREYAQKYKPVPLPTLVKEKQRLPAKSLTP